MNLLYSVISLFFSDLVKSKSLSPHHRRYNLYTKLVKKLEICKQFLEKLVKVRRIDALILPCHLFAEKPPGA